MPASQRKPYCHAHFIRAIDLFSLIRVFWSNQIPTDLQTDRINNRHRPTVYMSAICAAKKGVFLPWKRPGNTIQAYKMIYYSTIKFRVGFNRIRQIWSSRFESKNHCQRDKLNLKISHIKLLHNPAGFRWRLLYES